MFAHQKGKHSHKYLNWDRLRQRSGEELSEGRTSVLIALDEDRG
jgi:hypothetical protein